MKKIRYVKNILGFLVASKLHIFERFLKNLLKESLFILEHNLVH